MCGIFGLVFQEPRHVTQDFVHDVWRRLEHRGPDDRGFAVMCGDKLSVGREFPRNGCRAEVLLLHRRLSILDLSATGRQPMVSDDEEYVIAFNGEIYNYLELRDELRTRGFEFRSGSDTEVLLNSLIADGEGALKQLVGMFAIAFLDRTKRTLLLARDFFGIKPLYYASIPGGLAFSSEIPVLIDTVDISRSVDPDRLYLFLRYGITDHGAGTMFRSVAQLPPAHLLKVELDAPSRGEAEQFWHVDLVSGVPEVRGGRAADDLKELFLQSVEMHMRSDVTVGAALSGGIDSSAIVGAIGAIGAGRGLHTFTFASVDPTTNEERWARAAADKVDGNFHIVAPGAGELVEDMDRLVRVQGEPFGSTSIYAQYRVFQRAKEEGVTVMLDGQGADEVFAGYRPYLAARFASLVKHARWVTALRLLLSGRRLPSTSASLILQQAIDLVAPEWVRRNARKIVGRDVAPDWLNRDWFEARGVTLRSPHTPLRDNILRRHLHRTMFDTSLPHLLRYEDRNSMAFSIESRVPFLTPDLVNFAFALAENDLVATDGTSKAVLRAAMRGVVPDAILDRKDKVAFATPERVWLTELRHWVGQTLRSHQGQQVPALNTKTAVRAWDRMVSGHRRFDASAWRWINVIAWSEAFGVEFE